VDRLHAVSPTAQPATSRVTNNLAQLVKDSNVQQQQQRGSMDGVQVCNGDGQVPVAIGMHLNRDVSTCGDSISTMKIRFRRSRFDLRIDLNFFRIRFWKKN